MAKKQVTWQLNETTINKVKALAEKKKKAIQATADELIIKGLKNERA